MISYCDFSYFYEELMMHTNKLIDGIGNAIVVES